MRNIYASDNNLVEVWTTGTPSEKDIQEIDRNRYGFPIQGIGIHDREQLESHKELVEELFPESTLSTNDITIVENYFNDGYGDMDCEYIPIVGFAIVINQHATIDDILDIHIPNTTVPALIKAIGMSEIDFRDLVTTVENVYLKLYLTGLINTSCFQFCNYFESYGNTCMGDGYDIPQLTAICEKYKIKYGVDCDTTDKNNSAIFYFGKDVTEFKVKEEE